MAHGGTKPIRPDLTNGRPMTRALRLYREGERLNARGLHPVATAAFVCAARELDSSPCRPAVPRVLSATAARSLARARIRRALARERSACRCALRRVALALHAAAAVLCMLLLLHSLCDALFCGEIGAGAVWRSSSATRDSRTSGHLPVRGLRWTEPDYFFHTRPERRPWIEIDLGAVRFVRRVEIVNRLDCCWQRATALELAVSRSPDGSRLRPVTWRHAPDAYRFWRIAVRQPVRWIRITSAGNAPLHLADVRVFG